MSDAQLATLTTVINIWGVGVCYLLISLKKEIIKSRNAMHSIRAQQLKEMDI